MNLVSLDDHRPFTAGEQHAANGNAALATAFLRATSALTTEVVAVNEHVHMATSAAAAHLRGMDRAALWRWARSSRPGGPVLLRLDGCPQVRATCVPVVDGQALVGMLLELDLPTHQVATVAPELAHTFSAVVPGTSSAAMQLRVALAAAAQSGAAALVSGERGTGKSTVARHMLELGDDGVEVQQFDAAEATRAGWSSELSCALRRPHRILLTHLDDLPATMRPEVASALRRAHPGGRVVATATDPDMGAAVGVENTLGSAFERHVTLPPLRERLEDLPAIAARLLGARAGKVKRLDPGVRRQLWSHPWAGNVGELADVLEAAAALAPTTVIDESCVRLPNGQVAGLGARRRSLVDAAEAESLRDALQRCGGNKVAAADMLDMSRSTLYRKVRALGL